MKTNFTLFLIVFFSFTLSAQTQLPQPWPYSEGIEINATVDTANQKILKYNGRKFYKYDLKGNAFSIIEEFNYAPTGAPLNLKPIYKDTMTYDSKGRLIEQIRYEIDTSDATKITPYIQYIYKYDDKLRNREYYFNNWDGKNWIGLEWKLNYYNINNLDSIGLTGKGGTLHQNYSYRGINFTSGTRIDSFVSEQYDANSNQWNIIFSRKFNYKNDDTINAITFDAKRNLLSTNLSVIDSNGNSIFSETKIISSGNINRIYYSYNKNKQLTETKRYKYENNKFVFVSYIANKYYQDGALLQVFGKSIEGPLGPTGSRTSYTYTIRPEPPKVIAGFLANNECEGENTLFNNTSSAGTDSLTYTWNFGDGNTSTLKNPVHKYTAAGTYTVKLIAVSSSQVSDTFSSIVNVFALPTANFTTRGKGTEINFFPEDTMLASYTWDFGDGKTSTLIHPSHTFKLEGNYLVRLKVKNFEGCEGEFADSIKIQTNSIFNNSKSDISLNIFPNPARTTLNINLQENKLNNNNYKIKILSIDGRLIDNYSIAEQKTFTLPIGHLAKGTYILQLISDSGNYNKLFIKE